MAVKNKTTSLAWIAGWLVGLGRYIILIWMVNNYISKEKSSQKLQKKKKRKKNEIEREENFCEGIVIENTLSWVSIWKKKSKLWYNMKLKIIFFIISFKFNLNFF